MSANIPDDNAIKGSGAPKNPDASKDLWSLYLEEANERAKAKADLWNGSLSGFLLFAGLFAGVVSSFLIDSRTGLQPGASRSTVAINFLWYSSLTFTLISALAAVLAQTWIVKFSLVPTRGYTGAKERWIHDDKAKRWNLHGAVGYITVLIQLALFLFLAGLAVQAVVDRKTIGWTILSLVGATATLYLGITVLPWFSPATPFSTPFSDLNRRSDAIYISDEIEPPRIQVAIDARKRILGIFPDVKARAIDEWKERTIDAGRRTIDAGWRIIDAGRSFRSTFQNLVRTPPDPHVRQGICWEILKNSSNNESIRAAVLELTEKAPGPLRRKRLLEFGMPAKLCNRLEDLAHLPAGGDRSADLKRMKYYLHLTKWMLDAGRKSRTRTAPPKVRSPGQPSAIVSAFLPLLEGDALLNLDALPSVCRPLAFAIRVHLLVDRPSGPDIYWQPTDWNALVDALYLSEEPDDALNLEQDFAVTVFRAAIRGLGLGHPSDHLRDDCAGMLAVCIGSPRFSIDNTVVSSTSAEDRKSQNLDAKNKTALVERLELNTGASQSRKLIQSFFKHLVEHRNFLICTKAIGLLEKRKMVGSEVLSSLAQNDEFRDKIKEKLPKVLDLLRGSHHKEQERSAALSLAKQMGAETDLILDIVVKELGSPDWRTRVAGLETVMELIKMDQLPPAAEKVVKGIMSCAEFQDEDVQLAVIRTLHELVKHDRFQDIKDNMPDIIKLVADDDASVREAVVDFLAEIATKDPLRHAINMNIPAIVANYVEADSETWYTRRNGLLALTKFIETNDLLYFSAINKAFAGVSKWLSDADDNVQKGALNAVAVGLKTENYLPILKNWKVIPEITKMVNNEEADHDVRIAALQTCSSITQIKQAAEFKDIMENLVPQIMAAFSRTFWQMQIVMLKTITDVAQTESFSGIVSNTTVDEILSHLSNPDHDVRVQVLDTLEEFVSKDRFRGKIRDDVAQIMPLVLDDRSWRVQQAALRTFAVFAEHDIIRVSDNKIIASITSLLSGGDPDVCAGVLKILFIATKRVVPRGMYPVVKDSLVHENWQVRVAALRVLENLADNPGHETIDTPTLEILDCLSKDQEELRVAVLRTLPKFIDNKFLERVHATETLPGITLSLLKSKSEDIRLSVIHVISDMVTKTELYPAIDAAIEYMATLLNTTGSENEETRATIWNTVRSLINTEKYYQTSMAFAEALRNILQAPLSSDPPTDVRMAAFGIIPAISKYSEFSEVVSGLLPVLVKAALKDGIGDTEEYDTIFRIKALQALSDIATTQDTFHSKIDAQMAGNYTRGAKDRTLGRAEPETAVDEVVVDIIDMLQHDENNVRMAGLQFLTLPFVKEISLNPDKLVPTLVNLLSDWQEDIRTAVLRILSDLTKQEKFRVVFNGTLSALLEDLNGNDMEKKVTALKIWAALAQDETFRDIISGAADKLATCFQDPEDQVRLTALAAFSQFEAFRSKAIPGILQALEGSAWHIRLQAIKQLAKLAENDAFAEIINGLFPKIVHSLKDSDEDVRFEVLNTLSKLIQKEMYRKSIQGAFQAAGISTIVGLMSDSFKHVRIGALRLLPKVVELDPLNPTTIHSSLLKLLSDNDSDVCIAALEAITTLVQQCANSTSEIPRLIQLLKSNNLDHKMRSAALLTLSASIKKTVSAETVMDVVPVLCSVFTDTEDEKCWSAAAQVALRLASQGTPVDNKILTILTSALQHENWHVCVAGLNILSDLIKQEPLAAEILRNIPLPRISSLLEHSEKNVRVSAMHLIVSLGESPVEPEAKATLCAAIQGVWRKTFDDLESARPNNTDPTRSIYVAALENLTKLADFGTGTDWLPDNTELSRAVGHIIADVKDQTQSNQLRGVRTLSKLADNLNAKSRESLTCAVPKMTPLLSSSHTEIQLEVLGIFLKLVQHDSEQKVRSPITREVSDIIPVLVNREPRVRAAGLSVLLKMAEELGADELPEQLKSTMPHLLTLLENQDTRKNAVALISCLAKNNTLCAELLSKILSLIRDGPSKLTWGHLLLISRLLEDERLKAETSDLHFVLCLISLNHSEVQDFVLKHMTTALQDYLKKWITAPTFPASLSTIFAMPRIDA